jgi:hypothetical protein
MIRSTRNLVAGLAMASAVALTPAASASAATLSPGLVASVDAQRQGGLVNVNVSGNTTTVPISAAVPIVANVCGIQVQVGVIAQALGQGGTYQCSGSGGALAISRA